MPNKKNKRIIFACAAIIGLLILAYTLTKYFEQRTEEAHFKTYYDHENLGKEYSQTIQKIFDSCVKAKDTNGLRFLSLQLDTRLKMEDFRIKFKQADQTKLSTYLTTIISSLVLLIVGMLGLLNKQRHE